MKKIIVLGSLFINFIYALGGNATSGQLPNITSFTDYLINQIHTNAKKIGINESGNYFVEEDLAWKKDNYGHLFNLIGHFNMTNIINNLYVLTNTNESFTVGIIPENENSHSGCITNEQGFVACFLVAESPWQPYNNVLGVNIGGHRWNLENGKYVVRYYFNNVPSSHQTRIKAMMDEWEASDNNKIWFKNLTDLQQICGIWPVQYDCSNEEKDWGFPRVRIERHSDADPARVVGGLGANVLTTVLQYDPWQDNGRLNNLEQANNHGPTNIIETIPTAILSFSSSEDSWIVTESTDEMVTGQANDSYSWFNAVMRHELGHVLGFHHEQRRANRNSYLVFNCHSGGKNAQNSSFNAYFNTSYDYDSIMHYGSRDCNSTDYPNSRWAGHWNFLKKCTDNNPCAEPSISGEVVPSRIVLGYSRSTHINYDGQDGYNPDAGDVAIWGIGGILSDKDKSGVRVAYP